MLILPNAQLFKLPANDRDFQSEKPISCRSLQSWRRWLCAVSHPPGLERAIAASGGLTFLLLGPHDRGLVFLGASELGTGLLLKRVSFVTLVKCRCP